MSRRTRTLEILTAAGLVPGRLAIEQARGARDARVAQALASLVPQAISAGTNALGQVADYQADQDMLALKRDTLAARGETDKATAASQMARADAMKAKAEADKVKAVSDAEAAARKAESEASKTTAEQSMAALRSAAGAPDASLEALIGRASVDPGLGNLDDTAVAGILAEEQNKARKEGAGATLAERKAAAPLGPKPKSPEQIARETKRDRLLDLDIEARENELRGGPGSKKDETKRATDDKKRSQVLEVENFVKNIDDNITDVERLIDEVGTFEASGPESAIMDRKLTEIATDLAKLADPGSVAREGEVELQKRGLVQLGWRGLGTRNSTAKQVLEALRSDVQRRRKNAYATRGISETAPTPRPRPAGAQKPVSEMTDEELEAELAGGG